MKRITSVVVFSALTICFVNVKADHKARPALSIYEWFGVGPLGEKTFLAISNTLLLNSALFLGEFA